MFYLDFIIQRVFKIFIPYILPQDSAIYLISCCSFCVVGLDINLSIDIVTFYSFQLFVYFASSKMRAFEHFLQIKEKSQN